MIQYYVDEEVIDKVKQKCLSINMKYEDLLTKFSEKYGSLSVLLKPSDMRYIVNGRIEIFIKDGTI